MANDNVELVTAIQHLTDTIARSGGLSFDDVVPALIIVSATMCAAFLGFLFSRHLAKLEQKRDDSKRQEKVQITQKMLITEIEERWSQQIYNYFSQMLQSKAVDIHSRASTKCEAFVSGAFSPHDLPMLEQVVHFADRYFFLDDEIVCDCLRLHHAFHDIEDEISVLRNRCEQHFSPLREISRGDSETVIKGLNKDQVEELEKLWLGLRGVVENAEGSAAALSDRLRRRAIEVEGQFPALKTKHQSSGAAY